MQKTTEKTGLKTALDSMFAVGAQFGFVKSRRHPTVKSYIFGVKNKTEIFDLEKTSELLEKAKLFVAELAKEGKGILFVGSKAEARVAVEETANALSMPFVASRWIGGTLTNFPEIKKRIEKLRDLSVQKEKGELARYTKKERLLIDREIEKLQRMYGGLGDMKEAPAAMFVVDSKQEHIAVEEAQKRGLPVIALCGSDCDLGEVNYPIVGNDSSRASVAFFLKEIADTYRAHKS
jgi:small subunit ribosomal protein S2